MQHFKYVSLPFLINSGVEDSSIYMKSGEN